MSYGIIFINQFIYLYVSLCVCVCVCVHAHVCLCVYIGTCTKTFCLDYLVMCYVQLLTLSHIIMFYPAIF
jgi:hypothetical protein